MAENGKVTTELAGGIAVVSFYHPQSNSLPGVILDQLADAITAAGRSSAVKVIVLKSEGEKTFCAGASFDELISIKDIDAGKKFFSGFAHVINAIRKAPVFVIVRVQGKAVGGGVGLACAADYTLALDSAAVKLSELSVGIGPFVVGPAVERKIGAAAYAELAINATEWQSAQWAKEKGLYAGIFSSLSDLDAAVAKIASELSRSNPEAMTALKRIMWHNTHHWDTLLNERAEISGRLVLSDFTRKAIEKFKAGGKR